MRCRGAVVQTWPMTGPTGESFSHGAFPPLFLSRAIFSTISQFDMRTKLPREVPTPGQSRRKVHLIFLSLRKKMTANRNYSVPTRFTAPITYVIKLISRARQREDYNGRRPDPFGDKAEFRQKRIAEESYLLSRCNFLVRRLNPPILSRQICPPSDIICHVTERKKKGPTTGNDVSRTDADNDTIKLDLLIMYRDRSSSSP